MPQRFGETHRIACRVDRILYQQGGHRRPLGDTPGELQGLVLQFGAGKDLGHHAEAVCLVGVDRITGQQKLFGLSRAEFPRVGEVLDTRHAHPYRNDVAELRVVGGDDQVTCPNQHQPSRDGIALHLRDGDLAQIPPPAGVFEEEVPLLQIGALCDAAHGRAVRSKCRVLCRSGFAFEERLLRSQVVARGEVLAATGQDHHAHVVVGFGPAERLVQLHEQRARLRVLGLGTVEPDTNDPPLVQGLVGHLLGRLLRNRFGVGQVRASHGAHLVTFDASDVMHPTSRVRNPERRDP